MTETMSLGCGNSSRWRRADQTPRRYTRFPSGENTTNTEDFDGPPEGNGGTFIVVQSTSDGTSVDYSQKGVNGTQLLGRGESFVIPHVNQGDFVSSNNKIRARIIEW